MKHTRKIRHNRAFYRALEQLQAQTTHCKDNDNEKSDNFPRMNDEHGRMLSTLNLTVVNKQHYC